MKKVKVTLKNGKTVEVWDYEVKTTLKGLVKPSKKEEKTSVQTKEDKQTKKTK
jgi:hypothetical protein